jgi:hypothetical protein
MTELVKLEISGELSEEDKNKTEEERAKEENGEENISDENDIEITENFDWDSDVEQFPINIEKALEFTSRR